MQRNGTVEQKERFLPRFATGELRGGVGLTEPDCGTDLQAIRTVARAKAMITWSTAARPGSPTACYGNCLALLVKTDPNAKPRHRGMSLLIAEKGPGFTVNRKLEKLGYRGIDTCELSFDDYRVPADRLIGGVEGRGLQQILGGLELGRINVAARGVGIADAALRGGGRLLPGARRRSASRSASTRRSSSSSATWRRALEAARLLTWRAAEAYDRGERCDMEAGMAKLLATEAALENSIEAMRIHGGYGYSKEFNIERLYRDAPLLVIGEGTNELQRIIIAKQLIERNRV